MIPAGNLLALRTATRVGAAALPGLMSAATPAPSTPGPAPSSSSTSWPTYALVAAAGIALGVLMEQVGKD